ncbi:hypothetical protein H0R92_10870 [Treponema sp. OMZ 840]
MIYNTFLKNYRIVNKYERIEYTPYGEYRIENSHAAGILKSLFFTSFAEQNSVSNRKVASFTGKERDEETGLYYYGARYLDPRTSRWLSADPALGEYMAGSSVGAGGIYNQVNFNLYHYAGNNPVKYIDPDGREINNHDGTYTIEKGDTLWKIYGADWQKKSGYKGDPTKLQPGDVVGNKVCEFKKQESDKGVDLNFFPDGEDDKDIHNYAGLVDNPKDEFVIGGHGSTEGFQDRNGKNVSPKDLATLIKNNPNYHENMKIKMLSCNLGGKTDGYLNYAQRLANAMGTGVEVYGATELCWYFSDGSISVAGKNLIFKGQPSWIFRRGEFKCFTAQ